MKTTTTSPARDRNGNIIPDLTNIWQPPAQPTGWANATPVDTKTKRGTTRRSGR